MTWPEARQADLCGRICEGASQRPWAGGTVAARRELGPWPAATTDLPLDLGAAPSLCLPCPHLAEVSSCAQVLRGLQQAIGVRLIPASLFISQS